MPRRAGSRGFTLIEVMAALVIVALGMLGAIQAVTQSAGNGAYLRDKTLAHWIAMNRLTELRLAAQPPALDDSSGEVEYAKQHWRWNVKVSKTAVTSMLRIDVSAGLDEGKNTNTLATVTGFYGSAISQPQPAATPWDQIPQQQLPPGTQNPGTQTPPGTQAPTAPPLTGAPPVTNTGSSTQ